MINKINQDKEGWEYIRERKAHSFSLFDLRIDTVKNLRNQEEMYMLVVQSKDAANVIAITEDDKILIIEQFRFGTKEWTLEFPGGLIEPEEDIQQACARELLEETGYEARYWTYLGKVPSNPVFIDAHIHHFLAKGAVKVQDVNLDDGEQIIVHLFTREEFNALIKKGGINHPHSLSAIFMTLSNVDFSI